jgi:hypothetical protein
VQNNKQKIDYKTEIKLDDTKDLDSDWIL